MPPLHAGQLRYHVRSHLSLLVDVQDCQWMLFDHLFIREAKDDTSSHVAVLISYISPDCCCRCSSADFTLYLEAREQRRLRQKLTVVQPLSSPLSLSNNNFQLPFSTTNRFFGGLTRQIGNNYTINNNTSSSNYRFTYGIGGNHNNHNTATHLNYLNTPPSTLLSPLQPSSYGSQTQTRRPFLTSLRQDLHLKQLERIANTTPSDPNTQFEFLSQLSQTYPDAVIERFEQYKEFAIDERIVLLYLNCLQRTGMVNNRFGMKRFMDRIGAGKAGSSQNNNSMVSMGTIEALKELSKEKLGKGEMASRAAAVVAAGGSGGGMMPGSHYGGVGGGAGGAGGMFGARGTSPNSPLFIQTHNPKSTRDMLFAVVRTVAVAFVLVSALTV
eukprot:scaffold10485_cov106-Skeletonema_dohrnii-CCMP3373.AAC.11